MYDKEYSSSKHGGSKGGYHSYYGDHKKDGKSSVKGFKNYGHKKFGVKKGNDDHAYGKYGHHLIDDHGGDTYRHSVLPDTTYVTQHVPLTVTQHVPIHVNTAQVGPAPAYLPVIEQYGGALGHGYSSGPSVYSNNGESFVDGHGLIEYDTHNILPSSANMAYLPSASVSSATTSNGSTSTSISMEPDTKVIIASSSSDDGGRNILSNGDGAVRTEGGKSGISTALISTKSVTPPETPSVFDTIGETMKVKSAVHATPAVISTSNGAHYYNS